MEPTPLNSIRLNKLSKLFAFACLALSPFVTYSNDKEVQSTKTQLDLTPCFVDGIQQQARCGLLQVPENRALPLSEQNAIDVNVVMLPRYKEESKELPLVFLAGGPGQAATELAGMLGWPLREIRQQHDIILVDQRGTGQSNGMRCPAPEEDMLTLDDDSIDMKQEVDKCLAQFSDYHLPSYNTYDFIEDLEQVREALGYKQVHIYGGSYGTRAGFAYLKRYPESIKTATLDSTAPMQLVVGLFGKTSERAFDFLLEDCQTHDACNTAFPELKADYLSLMEKLKKSPIKQVIYHPISGDETEVLLSESKVVEALRATLYDLGSRQVLPYLIHTANKGDVRGLAATIATSNARVEGAGGMYTGLTMNIICNEDIPRASQQQFSNDADNYFSGELGHSTFTEVCRYWPKWQAPADFAEPLKTDVPVLLFSGKYDPVTPPAYADMAMETLGNAKHVVIEHGSHVPSLSMCTESIQQFMQKANFEDVTFDCADKPVPRMFFTDMNQLQ
ncbi:MAG: alpha/beta fold hydrolase [Gammaproteobacteria bacterium]|nr:alpha/beta fold hydrolase [Gammaproteobacteria bacterium]